MNEQHRREHSGEERFADVEGSERSGMLPDDRPGHSVLVTGMQCTTQCAVRKPLIRRPRPSATTPRVGPISHRVRTERQTMERPDKAGPSIEHLNRATRP